ncbi:MAG: single-stranded-DNA-specific exonuclease RecJ [Eubacterium sp.]|nr:single-stranded-DNA-specific exonuclease RecJ [Eubacterium sp.]
MLHKRWIVADADKEKASQLSEKLNIDAFLAFLLVSRGIDNELAASDFLFNDDTFSSPFSFKDMDKAVERINKALDNGEKICIYGDYDCDGVTSTALLFTFLEGLGANVIYFIPNRLTDGYGMNKRAIDDIYSKGTNLIITVDNGISAVEEAEYIYSLGMELVVTDHHQLGETLPKACAVVNPHRPDNDLTFRDYAGVGVAFKLACALNDGDTQEMLALFADLVAIGTIGDLVPLVSENRRLVKYGLMLINSDTRIGINALRNAAGNAENEITSTEVAFQLCPRINAAGRMDSADIAIELLISDDYDEARVKADLLNNENTHRHEVEQNIINDINEKINKNPNLVSERVIVIDGYGYHHGVIGIVASHILSRYGKPTIIIGVDGEEGVGSARSIEGFNIFEAISSCKDMLTHFGGHPQAAGLGIMADDIKTFRKRINKYAADNFPIMPSECLKLDCKLSPFYLDLSLVESLSVLEPYGADNPQAMFGLFNVEIVGVTPIGEGKHIRLECAKKGKSFKAVMFGVTKESLPFVTGDKVDLAVKLSKNFFKGRFYLSIRAVDIRLHGIDDDKYFAEKADYEMSLLGEKPNGRIIPNRDGFSHLYKFLKTNDGYNHSTDDLYFALLQKLTYGELCYALKAFEEVGIITYNKSNIVLNSISGKADLENTNVLKTLRGIV